MIWFSSDHHLGHERINDYCNRGYRDVFEMDSDLIQKWNSVVSNNDTVYYLGDLTMGGVDDAFHYRKQLNGKIFFIEGNHDRRWYGKISKFEYLPPIYELKYNKQLYVLSHYGMREWNKSYHGSYMLYGHSHGNLPPHGLSFDVGVDCWDGYPVSIEQVNEKMETLKNG